MPKSMESEQTRNYCYMLLPCLTDSTKGGNSRQTLTSEPRCPSLLLLNMVAVGKESWEDECWCSSAA